VSGAANDVSNSHEPSYYEIALTNRQVIVAFVLLLLCMVAAFFSGVWIGRESGVRSATEQLVRNAPPPAEEKKEGQNLEEFEFFDSAQKGKPGQGKPGAAQAKPAEPAPEPKAETPSQAGTDTTLAEDFGAEDTEAGAAPKPSAASPSAPPKKAPTPEATPAVAAKPAATPRPPKKPTEKPEPSAEPARAAGQVVIQVFSSPEKEQAERIRDRLVGGGHKAYLSPVEVSGRTMYRVRIGPFASRDKAQQAAEQVRKSFKLDTWVTE
jgi:cell division septation protein DedD